VESVLRFLLTRRQLDFVPEDDVLVITRSGKADQKLITRTYPVADLIAAPDKAEGEAAPPAKEGGDAAPPQARRATPFRSLMQAIESTVEPDSWESLSGPGTMSPVAQSGSLVIRQTWSNHRQVLQLLRSLRESKRLGPRPVNATGGK
jgi:hypothetical protein